MAHRAAVQPPPRPRRPFRSTLAIVAAGILLVTGIVLALTAFASLQPAGAGTELGTGVRNDTLVSEAALLVVGMLNIAAALGIYMHRRVGHAGWASRCRSWDWLLESFSSSAPCPASGSGCTTLDAGDRRVADRLRLQPAVAARRGQPLPAAQQPLTA